MTSLPKSRARGKGESNGTDKAQAHRRSQRENTDSWKLARPDVTGRIRVLRASSERVLANHVCATRR